MLTAELQPVQMTFTGSTIAPEKPTVDEETRASVKQWLSKIACAKKRWEPDFKRMRANMEFATGIQWNGQQKIDDDRYISNSTLRMVNQKVATLYAKNPEMQAKRRERLNYQIWDGQMESIQEAVIQAMVMQQQGFPLPLELSALFVDYQNGKAREKMVDKVCKTLEIIYQYFVDAQRPDFKEQAKQMVRRTIICSVSYIRPMLCVSGDEEYKSFSSVDSRSGIDERTSRAQEILGRVLDGTVQKDSSQVATLKSLALSLGASAQMYDSTKLPVRLEFDFPPSDSVIPDENCRSLKEFVAARWIAQKFELPVEDVNAIFGTQIKVGTGGEDSATEKTSKDNFQSTLSSSDVSAAVPTERQGKITTIYEVFDYSTKTRFFLAEGYENYLLEPKPVFPDISGFWHHFALTFNDIESDPETKATIFPPSDVELVKHAQMEWNRTRDALRAQRNANAPKYVVRKGMLSDEDKDKLRNAEANEVIELSGIPLEMKPIDFILPMQVARIDPAVYDTTPLAEDMLRASGLQEANIGPAQPNVTATVGTIAEQSRMTVSASNVDDLDGVLSRCACASGEMLFWAFPKELAVEVAGTGAVWPDLEANRASFINEVSISIKAASSGRPNKAVDIANFRELAPILLQAGANPVGIIEEAANRMDDNIDMSKFFPVQIPQEQVSASSGGTGSPNPATGVEQQQLPGTTGPSQQGSLGGSPSLSVPPVAGGTE